MSDESPKTRSGLASYGLLSLKTLSEPSMAMNTCFADDIECISWLAEVDLPEYTNTFLVNFSVGGNFLSRRRLGQLRLQDFPQMNITRYDHAKLLMEHIHHTLQFSFDSPYRVRASIPSDQNKKLAPLAKVLPVHNLTQVHVETGKRRARHRIARDSRRRDFDNQAWEHISKIRHSEEHNTAVDNLRGGLLQTPPDTAKANGRRRTFDEDDMKITSSPPDKSLPRGITYGNLALEYDTLMQQLIKLQSEQLGYYRNIIHCEVANIFFVNEKTQELMLYVEDGTWFRLPIDVGLAGYCASTGESLNIPDVYIDDRFNRYLLDQYCIH